MTNEKTRGIAHHPALRVQEATTRALVEAETFADAVALVLEAIGKTLAWDFATLWMVDPHAQILRCEATWQAPDAPARGFADEMRRTTFPLDAGLPGLVWARGKATWVLDVLTDPRFARGRAAIDAGFKSALAFSVCAGNETLAVIDLLTREEKPPDQRLLDAMDGIGMQLGLYLRQTQAMEALRDSEARKAAILESALDCIICMDHEGRITEFNPAAERTFGFAREEVLGREMASVIIPPSLRKAHREGLERYLETSVGPVLGKKIELIAVRKDGTEFPVELAVTRIQREGPPAFTGYIRDISHEKAADRALKKESARSTFVGRASEILASSRDYRKTLSKVARLAVPTVADWCAVDLAEPEGRLVRIAVAHADPEKTEHAIEACRRDPAGGTTPRSVERVIQTGEEVRFDELSAELLAPPGATPEHLRAIEALGIRSAAIAPIIQQGTAVGAITLAIAESKRKLDERDQQALLDVCRVAATAIDNARLFERAEREVHVREELMAVVSHDLRSLLGSVFLGASLIEKAAPPEAEGERLRTQAQKILHYGERMSRLISDLLDFATIQAGTLTIERSPERTDDLLDEAVDVCQHGAYGKLIRIEKQISEECRELSCDRGRLVQVFANLLGNAIKFSPAGTRVKLSAQRSGDAILFSVVDEGPGIQPEQLPHVFDRYWKGKRSQGGGTGLGLFIARGIIEAHQGRIWVDSQPGTGARFCFTVPIVPAPATRLGDSAI